MRLQDICAKMDVALFALNCWIEICSPLFEHETIMPVRSAKLFPEGIEPSVRAAILQYSRLLFIVNVRAMLITPVNDDCEKSAPRSVTVTNPPR